MVSHSLFLWFLPASSPYASGAEEFQGTDIKIFLEKVSQERLPKRQLCFIGPLVCRVARRGPVAHSSAPAARVAGAGFFPPPPYNVLLPVPSAVGGKLAVFVGPPPFFFPAPAGRPPRPFFRL